MTRNRNTAKGFTMLLLAVLLTFPFAPFGSVRVHASDIAVRIDGGLVAFDGQGPVVVSGRTLVPVRGVFEAMGFDIDWEPATETAVISNADYVIRITIGSDTFTTNGRSFRLDVPAQTIGGRTMVPIRLPLESVGFELGWDDATQTVMISSPVVLVADAPETVQEPDDDGENGGDGMETEDNGEEYDTWLAEIPDEEEEPADTDGSLDIGDAISVETEQELRDAVLQARDEPVVIYLADHINLDEMLVIYNNFNVTIMGSADRYRRISAYGDFDAIWVGTNSTLVLENTEITRPPGSRGTGIMNEGHLVLNSGAITRHYGVAGGGVYNFETGVFTMNGGTISHNRATWGAGVSTVGAVIMNGGTISGNIAAFRGGGINVSNRGVFTMNGGLITNNRANHGTGVHVYGTNEPAYFYMNGGEVRSDSVEIFGFGHMEQTGGVIDES